jgi:hypothetical protein
MTGYTLDRALTLLNLLFASAALVIGADDILSDARHVRDDEADADRVLPDAVHLGDDLGRGLISA